MIPLAVLTLQFWEWDVSGQVSLLATSTIASIIIILLYYYLRPLKLIRSPRLKSISLSELLDWDPKGGTYTNQSIRVCKSHKTHQRSCTGNMRWKTPRRLRGRRIRKIKEWPTEAAEILQCKAFKYFVFEALLVIVSSIQLWFGKTVMSMLI